MIRAKIEGIELSLETVPGLFSPRRIDAGTAALLSCVRFGSGDKVLDLGCGYGAIGIFAAKIVPAEQVYMIDNDPVAIECAARNAVFNGVDMAHIFRSNGFETLRETGFTKILCNPPYHVDFSVPKLFIEKGFNRLAVGGSMWFVTKRETWYRNKLKSVFGGVSVRRIDSYCVFEAVKKTVSRAGR